MNFHPAKKNRRCHFDAQLTESDRDTSQKSDYEIRFFLGNV